MHDRRFPASEAHRLDDPARKVWLPPAEVIDCALPAFQGMWSQTSAQARDISRCHWPRPSARKARSTPSMRSMKCSRFFGKSCVTILYSNVELIHADAESTTLPDACCNLVFLANVWHEFTDRSIVLEESHRILKRGGRIAILDWRPDVEREAGPPLDHRLDASNAEDQLLSNRLPSGGKPVNVGQYSWLVQGEKLP